MNKFAAGLLALAVPLLSCVQAAAAFRRVSLATVAAAAPAPAPDRDSAPCSAFYSRTGIDMWKSKLVARAATV